MTNPFVKSLPILGSRRNCTYFVYVIGLVLPLHFVAVFSYLAGSTSGRPLLKSYPPRPENLLVLRFIGIFSPEKEEFKTGRERLNDEKIQNFLLLSGIFSLLPSVRFFILLMRLYHV
jgi:hypothetical protein